MGQAKVFNDLSWMTSTRQAPTTPMDIDRTGGSSRYYGSSPMDLDTTGGAHYYGSKPMITETSRNTRMAPGGYHQTSRYVYTR